MRSTRSTRPRPKIILGRNQWIEELQGKLGTTPLTTEFLAYHFRQSNGYKSPNKGQEVDRKVREDQQVQRRIEGFDRRHERHRDFRALRKLFQKAVPRLQYLLGYRYNLLLLWMKYEIFAETNRVPAEQLRRHLNPWPFFFFKKKKKGSRGAKHGLSERQRMYYKAKEMLHKAR